jgi:Pex19 protein family
MGRVRMGKRMTYVSPFRVIIIIMLELMYVIQEDIENMLNMMMSNITSKEMLYDPLKELADKVRPPLPLFSPLPNARTQFPPYLTTHSATLPPADKHRYEQQLDRIRKILEVFEEDGYTDAGCGGGRNERVVELMGEVSFCFCFLAFSLSPFFFCLFLFGGSIF